MLMSVALSTDSDMLELRNSNRLTLYMHSNKNMLLTLTHILLVVCVISPVYAQPVTQKLTHRWVIGAGVNLRAEANLNAPVLTRMALNTPVNLIAAVPNSKYCEVELITSGQPA